ncbi:type II toxin-antitoxin system HicB family antitoxin [Pseudomonas costantinii]|uniref:Antitoxin HicB n=1 Tax=Pseudomonas costantinii TaxID=168469 RepID=A0A1S2UJ04_9PSED|nr:type II toxin-antitoxin system HicB family antitoxin [Pseudomonas costantinii]OIN45996.1 hypothetical protein BFL40_27560 [Pseudomonas costantinii]SEE53914.1 antitoxin HicB [Pseudomonas costantinii]
MYDYAIRFEQDDSTPGLAVFCRDLPELNSFGDDKNHALREAEDAIETALSIYVDQRRAIPQASPALPDEYVIRLSAVTVTKIVLWNEMMAQNMRKADLCKRLGLAQTQGDRLVDFLHTSKMEALEKALEALGVRVLVQPIDPEAVRIQFYPDFNRQGHRTVLVKLPTIPFSALPDELRKDYEGVTPQESVINLNDLESRWWLTEQDARNLKTKGWSAFSFAPMAYSPGG